MKERKEEIEGERKRSRENALSLELNGLFSQNYIHFHIFVRDKVKKKSFISCNQINEL